MKKLLITALLIAGVTASAQNGFFRPVDKELFNVDYTADGTIRADHSASVWLFRPILSLSAMQFNLTNPVTVIAFGSMGTGVSYQHFISQNGEPYANYGFNILFLFTEQLSGVEPAKLSIAGSVMAWQYVNMGLGYSFANKRLFLLTGISYSFNK